MPALPDYEASVSAEPLPGRPYPRFPDEESPAATGAAIGRGLEDVGAIEQQHYERAIATQVTDAHNQLQGLSSQLMRAPQTGALYQQGKNALDLQGYLDKYDQAATQIVSQVPNGLARTHAQLAASQVRNELEAQLNLHTFQQSKALSVDTAKSSVALSAQRAGENYNHPDILANALETNDISANRMADELGMSDETRKEYLYTTHANFHKAVLDAAVANGDIPMAEQYLDHVKGELRAPELKAVSNVVAQGRVDSAADKILAGYRQGTTLGQDLVTQFSADPNVSDDDKFQVMRQVEQGRAANAAMVRQNPQVNRQITGIMDQLASGNATRGTLASIDSIWQRGGFSDEQRLSLRGRAQDQLSAAQQDADVIAGYMKAYNTGTPLDPSDKHDKAGVSAVFNQLTGGTKPGSPEYNGYAAEVTKRLGVVPEPVVAWARTQLVGGEPLQAMQAAATLEEVKRVNPRAYAYATDEHERVLVDDISSMSTAGTPPLKSVELAREDRQLSRGDQKALDEAWRKSGAENSQAGALRSAMKGDSDFGEGIFFKSVPDAPLAMRTDYDSLTKRYYDINGGNIDQARKLAFADLKNAWGVSEVNGVRELMRYPPEAMSGLTHQEIRTDIAGMARDNGSLFPHDVDASKLLLAPIESGRASTSASRGRQWGIQYPDQFGALEQLFTKEGLPMVYSVPSNDTARAAREAARKAESDKLLAQAKARQEGFNATGDIVAPGL